MALKLSIRYGGAKPFLHLKTIVHLWEYGKLKKRALVCLWKWNKYTLEDRKMKICIYQLGYVKVKSNLLEVKVK